MTPRAMAIRQYLIRRAERLFVPDVDDDWRDDEWRLILPTYDDDVDVDDDVNDYPILRANADGTYSFR